MSAITNKRTKMQIDVDDFVNEDVASEPVQVQDIEVVFVAFEDFEGRVNQNYYDFKKGVPVKMPREQANMWLHAKKGYVK